MVCPFLMSEVSMATMERGEDGDLAMAWFAAGAKAVAVATRPVTRRQRRRGMVTSSLQVS